MTNTETFDLAVSHYHHNDLAEANKLFDEILNEDPEHISAINYKGLIALQSGQVDAAIENWKKSVAVEDSFDALSNLGFIYSRLNETNKAKEYLERAFRKDPNRVETAVQWAHLEASEKNFDKAEDILTPLLDLSPPYDNAFIVWAQVKESKGERQEAENGLKRLLSMSPNSTEGRLALAQFYYRTEGYENSKAQYEEILKHVPGHGQVQKEYACLLRDHIDVHQSIEVLESAIKSTPGDWELYYYLGIAFEKSEQTDQAIEAYEGAGRINSAEPFFQNRIAQLKQMITQTK